MGDDVRGLAYRDELAAAYDRIAALERKLAGQSADDPASRLIAWLEEERARIAANEQTRLTRAQRALPNLVIIPFGAFAVGAFAIGLWWLSALTVGAAVLLARAVHTFVRWRAESDRRSLARIDQRIGEILRIERETSAAPLKSSRSEGGMQSG